MPRQKDYTVEESYDSSDKSLYYYVRSPEFETEEEAEELLQKILENQKNNR